MKLLNGKNIFITGGARGLGKAFALEFAREGANVAINYSKSAEAAQKTCSEIEQFGVKALAFQGSVTDRIALENTVASIEAAWGQIDILVNNAGISQPLPFALMDEEDWDQVLDTNLKGTFLASKAVVRGMVRRKKGVVLNIGSLAGERMIDAPVHYYTSKAAIRGFTESLAKEMTRYGIRVNCLAPGLLEEGVSRNLPEHRMKDYLKHCAMGRVGTLEETAKFAAFLISDKNTYMSGETIVFDGGV